MRAATSWIIVVYTGCALAACSPGMQSAGQGDGLREEPASETSVSEPEPVPAAALSPQPVEPLKPAIDPILEAMYLARRDGDHNISAVDVTRFDPTFLRQAVAWDGTEAPGTIVIDTASRHLFLVEDSGSATRYGVAIGREGFGWTGEGTIGRKARWPRWTPPAEMIRRDPSLEKWREGMPGGQQNPLGARSLYIYFGDNDSLYRVHGTNEPYSIGRAASSGCFRMLNQDIIDLHARVASGARIIVR